MEKINLNELPVFDFLNTIIPIKNIKYSEWGKWKTDKKTPEHTFIYLLTDPRGLWGPLDGNIQ